MPMFGLVREGDLRAQVTQACRPLLVKGLKIAGAAVAADIRRRIATQGPPVSDPFRPPHMDTGQLHDSIFWEVDEANLTVYVIADTIYAYYLEYGTSRMAPRPFVRQGLAGFASRKMSGYVSVAFAAPRSPVDESLMRHSR